MALSKNTQAKKLMRKAIIKEKTYIDKAEKMNVQYPRRSTGINVFVISYFQLNAIILPI